MNWSTATLGKLAEDSGGFIQTGPFGTQLHEHEYECDGIPVIMPKDIIDGRINLASVARVSEQTALRLERHRLRLRALVIPRRGTITKRAFIREEEEGWLCGTGCLQIVLDRSPVVPEFLYHYMEQPQSVQWLEQHAVGTTMLNLSARIVSDFPVRFPPRALQERIAAILSAYDELIVNNRRRMTLLEDAARQLYHEWFVRLRFPGREHVHVVDGVPEGWRPSTLGACSKFMSGGTPSKARSDFWDGEIPWVSSGELTALRIDDATLHVTEEAVEAGSRMVAAGTILGVVRGMSLAKEFRLAMTSRPVSFNQDLKAIINGPEVHRDYLFHALVAQRDAIRDHAGEASHGTKKIETAVLAATPILIPPRPLQDTFAGVVRPMNEQWDNLNRQVRVLRAARDLLLPRLMSGEVKV